MAEAATLKERVILAHPATKQDIAGLKEDIVRLETQIDRVFYLILGSWITLALFIGGLYFR